MSREESICCNDLWASVGRGTCLGPVSVNAMQQPSCPRSGTAQDVFPMAPRHPAGVSASQKSRLEGCWRGHYSFCHLRARSMSPQGSLSSELPNAGAELPTALVFSNRQATFIRNSLIRDSLHLKGLRKEGVFHSRQQNYCSQCWWGYAWDLSEPSPLPLIGFLLAKSLSTISHSCTSCFLNS